MATSFAAHEVVELGIQIEKNGRDFYSTAAAKSKSPKVKNIFKFLAGEEEKHIGIFRNILDAAFKYEPEEVYPQEYFAYMNALAGDYVFTVKDTGIEAAKNAKNDMAAVDVGIDTEKKSILFYEGMRRIVPSEDSSLIAKLIDEEKSHLKKLLELKKEL